MEPGMSDNFKAELSRRVVDVILSESSPVEVDPARNTYYGWLASDWQDVYEHLSKCRPDYAKCTWDDVEWTEFTGTFSDDHDKTGVEVMLTCACGKLAGRPFRYTGGYADLLRKLTDQ
jgi:hypothetical protein